MRSLAQSEVTTMQEEFGGVVARALTPTVPAGHLPLQGRQEGLFESVMNKAFPN